MAMVVNIVNITDAPESKLAPTRLAIYTTVLDPGEELKLPASMVDARIRKLEKQGYIVIGQVPSWYAASKARKMGSKVLTREEATARLKKAPAPTPPPPPAEPQTFSMMKPKKERIKLEDLAEEKKSDKK